jgi:hypothetical protein
MRIHCEAAEAEENRMISEWMAARQDEPTRTS